MSVHVVEAEFFEDQKVARLSFPSANRVEIKDFGEGKEYCFEQRGDVTLSIAEEGRVLRIYLNGAAE